MFEHDVYKINIRANNYSNCVSLDPLNDPGQIYNNSTTVCK